jgi:hypothetical protein
MNRFIRGILVAMRERLVTQLEIRQSPEGLYSLENILVEEYQLQSIPRRIITTPSFYGRPNLPYSNQRHDSTCSEQYSHTSLPRLVHVEWV